MANLNVTLQQYTINGDGSTTGTQIGITGSNVTSVPVNVTDASNNPLTSLTISNFTIYSAASPSTALTNVSVTGGTGGNYIISFASGYQPNALQYLLINVTNNTDSGILFIDPSTNFDSGGQATINYPVSYGNQKFILGQVNQGTLLSVASDAFNFIKAAVGSNCSISFLNGNPLQSIVLPAANTPVPLQVTLQDGSTPPAPIAGNQSITISTQTTPLTRLKVNESAATSR